MAKRPVVQVASAVERAASAFARQPVWEALLRSENVACLVVSTFSSRRVLPALAAASKVGVPTIVVTNSWKDVFVNSHLPVWPSRCFVGTERAREYLLWANPGYPASRVEVAQSLHLAALASLSSCLGRDEFCAAAGLDPERPIVVYSAASPTAVQNEESVVAALADALQCSSTLHHCQLLLRPNPMEDGSRFVDLLRRHPGVRALQPRWEWDAEDDWCCPTRDDAVSWSAAVAHATCNVSIPSTVTLEFNLFAKPVVNICFDLPVPLPGPISNNRFWDASFYAEARALEGVYRATSVAETIALLEKVVGRGGVGERDRSVSIDRMPTAEVHAKAIENLVSR